MSGAASRLEGMVPKTFESSLGAAGRKAVLRFTEFEFDAAREQLRRNGVLVPLSPKPTSLLRYFLDHPERLITKQELMDSVWGDVVVTDDSLVQCVGELRSRLGERGGRLITTHPRRGYAFEAPVQVVRGTDDAAQAAAATTTPVPEADAAQVPRPGRLATMLSWCRRPRTLTALVALVLMVLGAGVYVHTRPVPYHIDDEIARRYSIVVTPLQDIGKTPATEGFQRALVDEIAAQLSRVTPNAIVMRSSTARGVRYAMAGTVAASGSSLAIDLQLRSVPQEVLVWTERYEYPDGAEPGIALDAALRAVGSLHERFRDMHRVQMKAPDFRPDPADLVLAAWDELDRRQTPADVERARARFELALKADPDSVSALTGIGAALMSERFGHSGEPSPADPLESERLAERAISIAPDNMVALINWADVQLFRNRPDLALVFFERAALNAPAHPIPHLRYAAALMYMGRLDEAQAQCETVLKVGRRSPRYKAAAWGLLGNIAFARGDDDKAYALAQRALAERPSFGLAYATLAAVDVLQGRFDDARKHMAEHLRLMPGDSAARVISNNPAGSELYLRARNRLVAAQIAAGLPEK